MGSVQLVHLHRSKAESKLLDLPERCVINVGVEVFIDKVQRSFLLEGKE